MRSFAARADENSEARNRTRRASLILPRDPRDLMTRADVDQIGGAPVGGIVMPENTLLVLSPWVALVGLVGFMAAVVVVAKKRQG